MANSTYNYTDPTVVFDPSYDQSVVIKSYTPVSDEENIPGKETQNTLKIDAVRIPIIRLNNKTLDAKQIVDFTLTQNDFVPKLTLTVNDPNKIIQNTDVPGMNNSVTIILTAPVNGANKKIKLDFFITNMEVNGTQLTYDCIYNLMDLHKIQWKQVGSGKLSTYEMLENISKECKLGFAATDKCKTVNDKRYRNIYSKKYIDFIQEQLEFNGEDEDSVMDAWIDLFGYVVLVNLSYLFKEEVDSEKLTTKVVLGVTNTVDNSSEQEVQEVARLISNDKAGNGPNNLSIATFEPIVMNDVIHDNGTLKTYYSLTSPGDKNLIQTQQIQIIENSIDGKTNPENYEYQSSEFLGIDFTEDDVPLLFQRKVVNNYLIKLRSKQLSVIMKNPNYSLQRGMLINVAIFVYEKSLKQTIITNSGNVLAPGEKDIDMPEQEDGVKDMIEQDNAGVLNPALSGLYYIDSEQFYYESSNKNIVQTLNLIKKGPTTNILNQNSSVRVSLPSNE